MELCQYAQQATYRLAYNVNTKQDQPWFTFMTLNHSWFKTDLELCAQWAIILLEELIIYLSLKY